MDDRSSTLNLIQRCELGDAESLEELVRRYYPVVRNIVRVRMRGLLDVVNDLDDLVQDSMLDAFKDLATFNYRSEGSFRNWLAKVVENNIVDALRKGGAQKRGRDRLRRISDLADPSSTDLTASIFPANEPTPSEVVRNAETEKALRAYLEQHLEEPYRSVVVLRNFCCMTFEEVANELQYERTSTVRSIHTRALAKIREALSLDSAGLL